MNGKGDRNRSNTQAYRDGWDRVFSEPQAKAFTIERRLDRTIPDFRRAVESIQSGFAETAMFADPDEPLTEHQKFAIAYAAGVRFTSTYENGVLTMTTEPCGIVHDGRRWVVTRKAKPQGDDP